MGRLSTSRSDRSKGQRRHHPARPTVALRVETLEDRTVPSTLTVTSAADDGSAGTLRSKIAVAQNGDTIRFANSLSYQTITLTQGELYVPISVTIQGLGADKLAISGNSASRVFFTEFGTDVTISRLTLTDGFGYYGGAILNVGTLTLDRTSVVHNSAAYGAAVVQGVGAGLLSITRSDISDNTADANLFGGFSGGGSGGAIYGTLGSPISIDHSTFTHNTATTPFGFSQGGAIVTGGFGAALTITHSTFANNTAESLTGSAGGGAITVLDGFNTTVAITNTNFLGNQTNAGPGVFNDSRGGAIQLYGFESNTLTVSGSKFESNRATAAANSQFALAEGGAIDVMQFATTISDSTFMQNQTVLGDNSTFSNSRGGAVSSAFGSLTVSGSKFQQNSTPVGANANQTVALAGGLLSQFGDVSISGTVFRENSTGGVGGGAWITQGNTTIADSWFEDNTAGGGAGGLSTSVGNVTITGSRFTGNAATGNGGGAYISSAPSLVIDDSRFTDNHAGPGVTGLGFVWAGGLAADGVTMTLTNSVFSRNEVVGMQASGGGVWLTGSATMSNVLMSHNRAVSGVGGAGGAFGGGLYAQGPSLTINASGFTDNRAESTGGGNGSGGGIYVGLSTALTLTDSWLIGNQAIGGPVVGGGGPFSFPGSGLGGGLYVNLSASATLSDVLVLSNTARGAADATLGGIGFGGGVYNQGTLTMTTGIVADNRAIGGAGATPGFGKGGGVYNGGTFFLDAFSLFFANHASTSDDDIFGPTIPI